MDGIELQTGAELISHFETRLDRIASGDVDWLVAKIAMGLDEGIALYGDDVIEGWKSRVRYSETQRKREVEANLGFFPIWTADDQLAARDAELFRRQMLLDGAFRIVAVLSALNRMYFSTFQFKRAGEHIARLGLKPERLAERLDFVANGAPSEAAQTLRSLVEETTALVRREMPDVDVDVPWQPPQDGR
jgi:hypothetical protein